MIEVDKILQIWRKFIGMSKKGSRKHGKFALQGGFPVPLAALFHFEGVKMDNKRYLHQSPRPEVRIFKPDGDPENADFILGHNMGRTLQAYAFSSSINDPKGSFAITLYPNEDGIYADKQIFDEIGPMYIVKIYEKIDTVSNDYKTPVFTGVIRKKKYTAQMTDNGPRHSIIFSGCSIAGLIMEFKISMDIQAMSTTRQAIEENSLNKKLTIELLRENGTLYLKEAIETIYNSIKNLGMQYGKLTNVEIFQMIEKWMGSRFEDIFAIDPESKFYYPIANVFFQQNTQTFYDIIDGLIPKPIYEAFPHVDENGTTKTIIRPCPFDFDKWAEISEKAYEISPSILKAFDVSLSDEEVYTVFYAYLRGYPITMEKILVLNANDVNPGVPGPEVDGTKYGRYGFRPLYVTMNGYGSKEDLDKEGKTGINMNNLSLRLKEWYCHLDEMYEGNITLVTDIKENMPNAGDIVKFIGGAFYVIASEHHWSYGGNPETVLSVSRGGDYDDNGKFKKMTSITKWYQEFKNQGDY
jgi:hypothetical protein